LVVGGVTGAVFLAGVAGAALGHLAARVLPGLAGVVPMETKLRKLGGDFLGLAVGELNPEPLADNLGALIEGGCLGA